MDFRYQALLLIALFLLGSLGAFCQWEEKGIGEGAELGSGSPYPVVDAKDKWYLTLDGKGVAVKKEDEGTFHVHVYDPEKLEQISHQKHELPNNKMVLESVILFRGELYILYNWWDDKKANERLFARRVDLEDASLNEPQKLLEIDGEVKGKEVWVGFLQKAKKNKFDFYFPDKGNHLIVRYERPEDERGSKDMKVSFASIDKNLQKEWKREVSFPFSEKDLLEIQYEVTRNGTFYVLAKVEEEDEDAPQKMLMRLSKDQGKFKLVGKFRLEDRGIHTLSAYTPNRGGLFLCGSYTKERGGSKVKGLFTMEIDSNQNSGKIYRTPIPLDKMIRYEKEELRKEYKKKGREHKDVGMEHLIPSYVHFLGNGDRIIIGEEAFYKQHYVEREHSSDSYKISHRNDLLAIRIGPKGDVKWMKVLPKRQVGSRAIQEARSFQDISFTVLNGKEQLHVLYTDSEKNKGLEEDEEPKPHVHNQGGILTSYSVDKENGGVTKNWILDIQDLDLPHVLNNEVYQFGLNRIMTFGDGKFATEVYKKEKEDLLIGVDLKE